MKIVKKTNSYQPMLGKSFIEQQTKKPVLTIGREQWSREGFAKTFGIANTMAAIKLSRVAKELRVSNVRDLYEKTSAMSFAQRGIGVTTLFVLFHVFASKGLNVQKWYMGGTDTAVRTFYTIKKRDQQAEVNVRKAAKRKTR